MLSITSPVSNIVYQRNGRNFSTVQITGLASGVSRVVASLMPVSTGAAFVQEIKVSGGKFADLMDVPAGYYDLTILAGNDRASVRFGVGEVFVLWGHSFMSGGHDTTYQKPATDERVKTLYDRYHEPAGFKFGKLVDKVGPFQDWPESWGLLGSKLTARLNVPVLFYGAAWGGSSVGMSYNVINGIASDLHPPGFNPAYPRDPFGPLELVFETYLPVTGCRAVLLEHGYNDRGNPAFSSQIRNVLTYIRNRYNMPTLSYVVVQEERTGKRLGNADRGNDLADLIATFPNVCKGPDFNAEIWDSPGFYGGSNHLAGPGIVQFATEWNNALTDGFFTQSLPVEPKKETALLNAVPTVINYGLALILVTLAVLYVAVSNRTLRYSLLALAVLITLQLIKY